MFILTLLALWLSAHYVATLVLAQDNHITTTTTTTLVISVYAFAPNASPPTMAITLSGNTDSLTLAATHTTTAMENIRSDLAQYHAVDTSVSPPIATPSLSYPTAAEAPYLHEATTPEWLLPVSISLLCYDFVAATAFIWCWVVGYFWWWRRVRTRSAEVHVLRAGGGESSIRGLLMNESIEGEMRRLGLV